MSEGMSEKDKLIAMLIKQNTELTSKIEKLSLQMEELTKAQNTAINENAIALSQMQVQKIQETLGQATAGELSSKTEKLIKKALDLLELGKKQGVWGPTF